MATRKIYIGSVGPYLFDDTKDIKDPNGDFVGEKHQCFLSNMQGKITKNPLVNDEIIRYQDLVIGEALPVALKTGPTTYTVLDTDYFLFCYCAAGDVTLNFPTAVGSAGKSWYVKLMDSSVNSLYLVPDGAELIDEFANVEVTDINRGFHVVSDGTGLSITTSHIPDTVLAYYFLLAGVSGGQIAYGGLDSGDDLELHSTAHATKGIISLGAVLVVDEENDTLDVAGDISVVGNTDLTGTLDVTGIITGDDVCAELYNEGMSIINASSVTLNNGTLISGTVSDTITINQTYYQVQEVTGVPGFDVEFIFALDYTPGKLTINARYEGNPAHNVVVEAWNYNTSAWDSFSGASSDIPDGITDTDYYFDYADLSGTDTDYISGTAAKIRIRHTTTGTATHNLYVDYVVIQVKQFEISTPGTFVTMTGFTEGESNNVTVSGTNGTMTVVKAGKYLINVSVSFSGTDNILFTGHIFKDGTQVDKIGATRKLGSTGDIGSVSFSGILSLVADEVLTLQITSDMVAYFAVEHINWNISRLN